MAIVTKILNQGSIRNGSFTDLEGGSPAWADLEHPTDQELTQVARFVGIEPQELREYLDQTQRPLVHNVEHYSMIIVAVPVMVGSFVRSAPLVIFVSKNRHDFITLHEQPVLALQRIAGFPSERMATMFKGGMTHILFTMLDEIVDTYFSTIDTLSDQIEKIEQHMFDYRESKQTMQQTFRTKKSLIFLHKALVANRDVVAGIEKEYAAFLENKQLSDFRELNGNIVQLIEMVTTYRDILTSSIEIHLSTISNNLNVTMKRVTSWGALILVPSLIAGIFGMNFRDIPFLYSHWGFWLSLVMMVVSVFVLARYFKRKDWF
jgi:magnesium transporter